MTCEPFYAFCKRVGMWSDCDTRCNKRPMSLGNVNHWAWSSPHHYLIGPLDLVLLPLLTCQYTSHQSIMHLLRYFWVQLIPHYFAGFLKCSSLSDKSYLSSSTCSALACYDFTSCSNLFSATYTLLYYNCTHLSSIALHLAILPILIQALSIIHRILLYDQ